MIIRGQLFAVSDIYMSESKALIEEAKALSLRKWELCCVYNTELYLFAE